MPIREFLLQLLLLLDKYLLAISCFGFLALHFHLQLLSFLLADVPLQFQLFCGMSQFFFGRPLFQSMPILISGVRFNSGQA